MSSTPAQVLPEDQLLELLTQLQKTTPDQARAILNAQPTIGYALVPLMARMGLVSLDVLQTTLSSYAAPAAPSSASATPASAPAIPAHLTQTYGHPTPPPAPTPVPVPANTVPGLPSMSAYSASGQPAAAPGGAGAYTGYPGQGQNGGYYPYGQQQQWNGQQASVGAGATVPPAAAAPNAGMLGALGNIPDEQREMIMRVIAMTPEQIRNLPPQERAITVQLRATLGLPTE